VFKQLGDDSSKGNRLILIAVYCRFVVHTDAIIHARARKMVSHTRAHCRIGFTHDQHGEEQNTIITVLKTH